MLHFEHNVNNKVIKVPIKIIILFKEGLMLEILNIEEIYIFIENNV